MPASFIRKWLTSGRRGFKSLVTGTRLKAPLVEYLGDTSQSGVMINLQPFLPVLFGGIMTPVAQRKISVFYTALINLPVQPMINAEVNKI